MSEKPIPIPASRMPKGAKRGLTKAVYKGWVWERRDRPSNYNTPGGVFVPVRELIERVGPHVDKAVLG